MSKLEGKRILIVEDDTLIYDVHARALRKEGAEVLWAANGSEAVPQMKEGKIDVILIDRLMPGASGDDLIKTLQEDERLSRIPVMVVSNVPLSPEDKKYFDKIGVAGYYVKAETRLSDLVDEVARATQ